MSTTMTRPLRAWRYFHPLTLLVGLLLQLHLGWLLMVDHLNPVPPVEQLQRVAVEVLQVQDHSPQLQIRGVDNQQRSMEFPASVAWLARTHTPLETDEWASLQGCMGYVLGAPMRWVRDERFQIWELHCGPVHRVYAEFKDAYEAGASDAQRAMEWHGGIILLLTLVVLVLEHRALRRRRLE